jgi:hypothetical protein
LAIVNIMMRRGATISTLSSGKGMFLRGKVSEGQQVQAMLGLFATIRITGSICCIYAPTTRHYNNVLHGWRVSFEDIYQEFVPRRCWQKRATAKGEQEISILLHTQSAFLFSATIAARGPKEVVIVKTR